MTPVEIDKALAEQWPRLQHAEQLFDVAVGELHHALGDRPRRGRPYQRTTEAALTECRERASQDGHDTPWLYPREALRRHRDAAAHLAAIRGVVAPYEAEWERRGGWSRFFTAGHIHAGMDCHTCNRGMVPTRFTWNPELSGTTEAEALAALGAAGHTMCTVCFPNAPVLPAPVDPRACPGTRDTTVEARWYGRTRYGRCADCGENAPITLSGALRRHRRPAK